MHHTVPGSERLSCTVIEVSPPGVHVMDAMVGGVSSTSSAVDRVAWSRDPDARFDGQEKSFTD